jgi:metacaspase-1
LQEIAMTVLLPAFVFEAVTAAEMARRRAQFMTAMSSGRPRPVIIAEGDSWFCYPRDSVFVPDHAPLDVIAQLSTEFAVNGVAKPGDTAQTMVDFFEPFVTQDIQTWSADLLLLSAGGNDLLGEGKLASFLRGGDRPLSQYLRPEFFGLVEAVLGRLERMVRAARAAKPDLKVILHGYDYANPSGNGPWLRNPMTKLGIPGGKHRDIIKRIVDSFYSRLQAVADELDQELADGGGEIVVLDLRGTVPASQWYDELHPNTDGFKKVRARYRERILKLHPLTA